MRHYRYIVFALLVFSTAAQAQWLRVWQGGESTRYSQSEAKAMPFASAGQTLTIGSDSYSASEIDSLTIVQPVTVTWIGSNAIVNIPDNVEGVTASVSGGDVIINNTNTWSEQEFILSGSSSTGSLTYNGSYKVKFHLNGVNITSTTGAALDIQCGKRIDIIVEDGTTNTLTDYASGSQKAAFNCQGHLEFSGAGSLTIKGNAKHALRAKEYILLKKSFGSLTVASAASDGIHCGEYFQMNGGTVKVSDTAGDGIQVETATTSDEVQNGMFIVNGGSIEVSVTAQDVKGIRLDADSANTATVPLMQLLDGSITVELASTAISSKGIATDGHLTIGSSSSSPVVGVSVLASASNKTGRATGIKVGKSDDDDDYNGTGYFTISSGTTNVNVNANYGRGINTNYLISNGGSLTVTASGTSVQYIKLGGSSSVYYKNNGGTVTPTDKFK